MSTRVRHATVLESFVSIEGVFQKTAVVFGFAFLTALCAKVRITLPFSPVPITMQTFAVLISGLILGSRLGAASMLVYMGIGVSGLPFFSGGGGIGYLAGPTGGYLVGFIVAAYLVGYLAERGWDRKCGRCLIAIIAGETIIYAFGLLWLSRFVPGSSLLMTGLVPFIPGDLIKIGLVSVCLPCGWKLANYMRGREKDENNG